MHTPMSCLDYIRQHSLSHGAEVAASRIWRRALIAGRATEIDATVFNIQAPCTIEASPGFCAVDVYDVGDALLLVGNVAGGSPMLVRLDEAEAAWHSMDGEEPEPIEKPEPMPIRLKALPHDECSDGRCAIMPLEASGESNNEARTCHLDSLEATITRGVDGRLVVEIDGPLRAEDLGEKGEPLIRVWLNETVIYNGSCHDCAHGSNQLDVGACPHNYVDDVE